MTKTRMQFEDIIRKEHFRSIIELTNSFQKPEDRGKNNRDKEEGLQLIHYRYALQKNAKETISPYNQARMKDFFGDKLDKLFRKNDEYEKMDWPRDIYKDCIRSGNTINNFFKKLVKDYNLLDKKKGKNGKSRYIISPKLNGEYRREGIKNALDTHIPESIISFEMPFKNMNMERISEVMPYINTKTWITHTIFGLPSNILDLCNDEEKELIIEYMTHLYLLAAVLMNLKYKKTRDRSSIGIFVDTTFKLKFYS